MRMQTINIKNFMDGSYKEPIQYYGDYWQRVSWMILTPIITLVGLEMALLMCEMLMHLGANGF